MPFTTFLLPLNMNNDGFLTRIVESLQRQHFGELHSKKPVIQKSFQWHNYNLIATNLYCIILNDITNNTAQSAAVPLGPFCNDLTPLCVTDRLAVHCNECSELYLSTALFFLQTTCIWCKFSDSWFNCSKECLDKASDKQTDGHQC